MRYHLGVELRKLKKRTNISKQKERQQTNTTKQETDGYKGQSGGSHGERRLDRVQFREQGPTDTTAVYKANQQ